MIVRIKDKDGNLTNRVYLLQLIEVDRYNKTEIDILERKYNFTNEMYEDDFNKLTQHIYKEVARFHITHESNELGIICLDCDKQKLRNSYISYIFKNYSL